jgi:hypothetical protein
VAKPTALAGLAQEVQNLNHKEIIDDIHVEGDVMFLAGGN